MTSIIVVEQDKGVKRLSSTLNDEYVMHIYSDGADRHLGPSFQAITVMVQKQASAASPDECICTHIHLQSIFSLLTPLSEQIISDLILLFCDEITSKIWIKL